MFNYSPLLEAWKESLGGIFSIWADSRDLKNKKKKHFREVKIRSMLLYRHFNLPRVLSANFVLGQVKFFISQKRTFTQLYRLLR